MKAVIQGKDPGAATLDMGSKDKLAADAVRLASMPGARADVDALLKQVETLISTTQRRQGAQAVVDLLKSEIPKLRPDDAIAFTAKTLDYLGRINPRHGGAYGQDFHLWLFHRDYLKIGVVATKLMQALPVQSRDLAPVVSAMNTFVAGVRSTSSCYAMIEPNGVETQDQYCGFYEIWDALKGLHFPGMGPGWGTMRDLGWLDKNQP
jgi:hypothetical protein